MQYFIKRFILTESKTLEMAMLGTHRKQNRLCTYPKKQKQTCQSWNQRCLSYNSFSIFSFFTYFSAEPFMTRTFACARSHTAACMCITCMRITCDCLQCVCMQCASQASGCAQGSLFLEHSKLDVVLLESGKHLGLGKRSSWSKHSTTVSIMTKDIRNNSRVNTPPLWG